MTETVVARRPRTARWIALGLAVVVALLVGILATREPAASRLVKSPLVGGPAPVLDGVTLADGSRFSLDDQRGRFVVVNFFATWCVPCQKEHPELVRFANAHAASGDASVVSVVFSDDADAVKRFFAERGGDWPVVGDDDGAIATAWGVPRVPESYLIAPGGQVVGKVTGGVTFDFLEEQFARFGQAR